MVKTSKFKLTIFDENGNIKDEGVYSSLSDITRDYEQLPYATLYYILNYTPERKAGKKMKELMKRIKVESIIREDLFQKRT